MAKKIISCEYDLSRLFIKNHRLLGYDKIVRNNNGRFPDFTMEKKGKAVGVELETLSSNFILHKHNKNKVDEVVCVKKDKELGVEIIEASELEFIPRMTRVSATISQSTDEIFNEMMKNGNYRNKSHAIESAIKMFWEQENDK